jgi:SAM-dependent methyltransferase
VAKQIFGLDLDPELVERARSRAAAAGVANCVFIVGDGYALAELVPAPVSFVLIANTFHGVPDKARLARVVAARLKPGGRLAVIN